MQLQKHERFVSDTAVRSMHWDRASFLRGILLTVTFIAIPGCVTMTPAAQHIQVQKQDSALLKDCTKLGRVDAKATGWGQWNYDDMNQQAANNLRDAASNRYPEADTVVVLNVDTHTNSADASGVAYKCY